MKVLCSSFHLNGHIVKFFQGKKNNYCRLNQFTLGVKGVYEMFSYQSL